MNVVERIVRVVFKGDDQISGATQSAGTGIGAFTSKIPGWAGTAALLATAFAAIGSAVTAAKQFVLDSMNAYDAFSASQRKLEGTAKLTGVALSDLKDISKDGVEGFKLSTITANDFAAEIAKLTSKAGDLTKSKDAMASFLDIGAARGLTASDTLKAVQQAILGIDEGTDKLFGKNPSVLYEEYADKVGKSAGKLSDQEKALALLDATMQGGELVRGSYQDYLGSAAGLQEQLTTKMDTTKVAFGTALQPVRTLVLQGLVKLVEIGTPVVLALGRIANFAGVTLGLKFQDARIAVGGFAEVMGKLTRSESLEAWGRAQVKAATEAKTAIYLMGVETEKVGDVSRQAAVKHNDASKVIGEAAKANADNTAASVARMSAEIEKKLGGPLKTVIGITEGAIRSLADAAKDQLPPETAAKFDGHMQSLAKNAKEVEARLIGAAPPLEKSAGHADKLSDQIGNVARDALDAASEFGVIDEKASKALTSSLGIADAISSIVGGSVFAGVGGLLGGVAAVVSALTADSKLYQELQRESQQRLRENTLQSQRLTREVGLLTLDVKGGDVASIESILADIVPQLDKGGSIGDFARIVNDLRGRLLGAGLGFDSLVDLSKKLNLNILDRDGAIDFRQLRALLETLQGTNVAAPGTDFSSQLDVLKQGFGVYGTGQGVQLQQLFGLAGRFSPTLAQAFNANDLQLTLSNLQNLFNRLESGQLTEAELGGLSGSQFRDFLVDAVERTRSLRLGAMPASGVTPGGTPIGAVVGMPPLDIGAPWDPNVTNAAGLDPILRDSLSVQKETLAVLQESLGRHVETVDLLRYIAAQRDSAVTTTSAERMDELLEIRRRGAMLDRGLLPGVR